jgi:hypothetical protein
MTGEYKTSVVKCLFDSLRQLYSQSRDLLLESDKIMSERGWTLATVSSNNMTAELSGYPHSSDKWFPRWAFRFYIPSDSGQEPTHTINCLQLVSIHFTSDHDTVVEEPLLVAGHMNCRKPLERQLVIRNPGKKVYNYWLCKSWFWSSEKKQMGTWYTWINDKTDFKDTITSIVTFAVPLFQITSREILEREVIERLFEDVRSK